MRSLRSKLQETLGLPGHEFHGEDELLGRVAAMAKLAKQVQLMELAHGAARVGGAFGSSVSASHPGHGGAGLEAPATALDMWRTLLALADDAGGGKIDAEDWAGICGNMFALLRGES